MLISNTKSYKLLIMYIDLDMIITGNIDELIYNYRGRFSTLTTNDIFCEQTQDGYNSSIMLFEVSKKGENEIISSSVEILYETLKAYYQQIFKYLMRFDHYLEMLVWNADII